MQESLIGHMWVLENSLAYDHFCSCLPLCPLCSPLYTLKIFLPGGIWPQQKETEFGYLK